MIRRPRIREFRSANPRVVFRESASFSSRTGEHRDNLRSMTALITRHIASVAQEILDHFPAIVIEGARQVGKSTFARQIAAEAVVMNLDDEPTRAAAAADAVGWIAAAGDRPLIIDEIQRMPELTLAVKSAIDKDRRPGRFILTGSASVLRVRGLADSLVGRAARLTMFGFSRGEAAGVHDDYAAMLVSDPAALVSTESDLSRADYALLLATGAYPDVGSMPPRVRATWFDSYVKGIVGRDMTELRRSVEPSRATAVLRTLAGRPAAELVKARLAAETAVPERTITGYLDLLHDVGLVESIPPWTPNLAKREVGRPKTFVIDSGLALWLSRVTPQQLARFEYGEPLGAALEAFVAAELLRQRTWSDVRFDLFHYRDRDGDEVDLILELEDGRIIGVEVKASASYSASQFKGLARMRDRLGDRFIAGVVLGTASTGYRYADRLWGAPISALWSGA